MSITNLTPPAISGTARSGSTLTSTTGTWSHDTPGTDLTFVFQWRRCDTAGANCSDIENEVSPSYVISSTDIGHTIRSLVTATETTPAYPDANLYPSETPP